MGDYRSVDIDVSDYTEGQAEHDALYSNPERQREHLREQGYSDDEIEEMLSDSVEMEEAPGVREKTHQFNDDTVDYVMADDVLERAHEAVVQWKADEADPDLSKAPPAWTSGDQVPEFVLDTLRDQIRSGDVVWQGGYDRLPPSAEVSVEQVLEERMTQPQGFSLQSLLKHLKEALGDVEVDDGYLVNILRNETSALLNTAREEAYEESERADEEFEYDWVGPTDWRTTDTCLSIEERIEDRGGSVPMEDLKQILYEEAVAHADAEGTPERVDDWQPHYQCRRTFTRRVKSM